jgi:hypothetical protein
MSSKPTTMELLEGLADAFNSRDVDRVMSFFHADCSLDMPRGAEPHGTRYVGAAEVRRGLKSRFEMILMCTMTSLNTSPSAIPECPNSC